MAGLESVQSFLKKFKIRQKQEESLSMKMLFLCVMMLTSISAKSEFCFSQGHSGSFKTDSSNIKNHPNCLHFVQIRKFTITLIIVTFVTVTLFTLYFNIVSFSCVLSVLISPH